MCRNMMLKLPRLTLRKRTHRYLHLFLPISFNNRTGPFEANKGVRDSKKHSYDNRVQNSESHKRMFTVKGWINTGRS